MDTTVSLLGAKRSLVMVTQKQTPDDYIVKCFLQASDVSCASYNRCYGFIVVRQRKADMFI